MKYILNENIKINKVKKNEIKVILQFQRYIIDSIENKDFFVPLTEKEILFPIKNKGLVYTLLHNDTIIGFFILTLNPSKKIMSEYNLDNLENLGLFDGIMIKKEYRGSKLQQQCLEYIEKKALELGTKQIIATVHPKNIWSLNNFIDENYKIIAKKTIHGGPRYILQKIL